MSEKYFSGNRRLCKLFVLLTISCSIIYFFSLYATLSKIIYHNFNYTVPIYLEQHLFQQQQHPYQQLQQPQQVSELKIVIPFHIKQLDKVLDNINKWKIFQPCDMINFNNKSVELIFYVGYTDVEQSFLRNLSSIMSKNIDCFVNKHEVFFKYNNKDEDQHVKGARLMFESMLNRSNEHFNRTSFVFYMEPDVRPIKSNWLNALMKEIGNGNFWIKGSCFRGDINKFKKNDPYIPNYMHINGNALYNLGSDDFKHFYFSILRPYVIKKNGDSKNAYDTDFFEFFFDKDNYEITRNVVHQFHMSDFVQNYWQTEFEVKFLEKKFPNTYFVHGGIPRY
nr:uncharacterized protein LOC124817396 [Hydra vulgaris]